MLEVEILIIEKVMRRMRSLRLCVLKIIIARTSYWLGRKIVEQAHTLSRQWIYIYLRILLIWSELSEG